eukprot:3579454-Prymnesium_polylepis.3
METAAAPRHMRWDHDRRTSAPLRAVGHDYLCSGWETPRAAAVGTGLGSRDGRESRRPRPAPGAPWVLARWGDGPAETKLIGHTRPECVYGTA